MGYSFMNGDKNDSEMHGPRWYRFKGKLPEQKVEDKSCGTEWPAWLNEEAHPTLDDGIVERSICFGKECYNPTKIKVAACNINNEFFYAYKLEKTLDNDSGYCWVPY